MRASVLVPAALVTLALLGTARRAAEADSGRPSGAPTTETRARNTRQHDIALSFQHGARLRTATLVVPAGEPTAAGWPVVLLLHGAGGSGEQFAGSGGWRDIARRERFVLVAADGTPANEERRARFASNTRTWNSGTGSGLSTGDNTANSKQIDDVGYLIALIDTVATRARVDTKRVFVAGHSNGAGMSYRLAAEHPRQFAAVGVMAGHLYAAAPARLSSPVPLIQIIGDRDPLVPMNGGPVRIGRGSQVTLRPALESPTRWAAMNGIGSAAQRIVRDDSVTVRQWGPSASGTIILSYVVKGHGHSWLWPAGGKQLPERLVGPTHATLNATETIWAFFAERQ
jgi:polyhydroxybutyrate depolymerase